MLVQEEENASEKPAAKARPILKPSSTNGSDFTPIERRQSIDIETPESNDPYCFQVSNITRFLRHNLQVDREEDAGVHCDQIIDECTKKQFDNTGYWSDEMKNDFVNAPHQSIDKWISVLTKGGGQKKRFQCCFSNNPQTFLYLRAIQGHSRSTANPALQDNVLFPEVFIEDIYHVTSRKRKRIKINNEPCFDSKRSQSQNKQTSRVLRLSESDG